MDYENIVSLKQKKEEMQNCISSEYIKNILSTIQKKG